MKLWLRLLEKSIYRFCVNKNFKFLWISGSYRKNMFNFLSNCQSVWKLHNETQYFAYKLKIIKVKNIVLNSDEKKPISPSRAFFPQATFKVSLGCLPPSKAWKPTALHLPVFDIHFYRFRPNCVAPHLAGIFMMACHELALCHPCIILGEGEPLKSPALFLVGSLVSLLYKNSCSCFSAYFSSLNKPFIIIVIICDLILCHFDSIYYRLWR